MSEFACLLYQIDVSTGAFLNLGHVVEDQKFTVLDPPFTPRMDDGHGTKKDESHWNELFQKLREQNIPLYVSGDKTIVWFVYDLRQSHSVMKILSFDWYKHPEATKYVDDWHQHKLQDQARYAYHEGKRFLLGAIESSPAGALVVVVSRSILRPPEGFGQSSIIVNTSSVT